MKKYSAVFGTIVLVMVFAVAFVACSTDTPLPARDYFIVTFNNNEGDTDAVPTTVKVWPADPYVKSHMPVPPAKADNIFDGWLDEEDHDFDADTRVTRDMTVYAQWIPGAVAVSKNGGRGEGFDDVGTDALIKALDYVNTDFVASSGSNTYTVRIGSAKLIRTLENPYTFSGTGLEVILEGPNAGVTITRSGIFTPFSVDNDAELTFRAGITLDGESKNGSGVFVELGKFIMEGGTICGFNNSGVYVNNAAGTFKMTAGTIRDNNAANGAGIYNTGVFTMEGVDCEISENIASGNGGGVYNAGTFTMIAGTIRGNEAQDGAGVYNQLNFTMEGQDCEISENIASGDGGAVYVTIAGTFSMTAGSIGGNEADNGGGVCNWGKFYMDGGVILSNTALTDGGGVATNPSPAIFNKIKGVIYGSDAGDDSNTAINGEGHAVFVYVTPGVKRDSTVPDGEALSLLTIGDEDNNWEPVDDGGEE